MARSVQRFSGDTFPDVTPDSKSHRCKMSNVTQLDRSIAERSARQERVALARALIWAADQAVELGDDIVALHLRRAIDALAVAAGSDA
ncbi:MAG: hypothetical protein AAF192_14185 [Pseudomonadota bacterium]